MNKQQPLRPDLREKAEKEFEEFMLTGFPVEHLNESVLRHRLRAISFENPKSLNCTWAIFKSICVDVIGNITIQQMGFILNSITNRTAKDLQLDIQFAFTDEQPKNTHLSLYVDLQDAAFAMAAKWNELVQVQQARIEEKYSNMAELTKGLA